jgi:hypothetical protein
MKRLRRPNSSLLGAHNSGPEDEAEIRPGLSDFDIYSSAATHPRRNPGRIRLLPSRMLVPCIQGSYHGSSWWQQIYSMRHEIPYHQVMNDGTHKVLLAIATARVATAAVTVTTHL